MNLSNFLIRYSIFNIPCSIFYSYVCYVNLILPLCCLVIHTVPVYRRKNSFRSGTECFSPVVTSPPPPAAESLEMVVPQPDPSRPHLNSPLRVSTHPCVEIRKNYGRAMYVLFMRWGGGLVYLFVPCRRHARTHWISSLGMDGFLERWDEKSVCS